MNRQTYVLIEHKIIIKSVSLLSARDTRTSHKIFSNSFFSIFHIHHYHLRLSTLAPNAPIQFQSFPSFVDFPLCVSLVICNEKSHTSNTFDNTERTAAACVHGFKMQTVLRTRHHRRHELVTQTCDNGSCLSAVCFVCGVCMCVWLLLSLDFDLE